MLLDMLHDTLDGMLTVCFSIISTSKRQEGSLGVEDDLCDKAIVWNLGRVSSSWSDEMCNL